MGKFAVSIEHSKAKSVSASGGFAPLTPDHGLCPWTPLEAPPSDPRYRLMLPTLAMPPLYCGPPAGGKLTKWPPVSKRLDSTDLDIRFLCQGCAPLSAQRTEDHLPNSSFQQQWWYVAESGTGAELKTTYDGIQHE